MEIHSIPSEVKRSVELVEMYDQSEAHESIRRSMKDYQKDYGLPQPAARKSRGRKG